MTQYVTPLEARVIAEAAMRGVDRVHFTARTDDVGMCGRCGRIVCHPDCPQTTWTPPK